jgi:hypothetical protein
MKTNRNSMRHQPNLPPKRRNIFQKVCLSLSFLPRAYMPNSSKIAETRQFLVGNMGYFSKLMKFKKLARTGLCLLLASIIHTTAYANNGCWDILNGFFNTKVMDHEFNLPIVEGPIVEKFKSNGKSFSYSYENIFLNLENYENLDHLAWILSQGRNPQLVKEQLMSFKNQGQLQPQLTAFLPEQIRELVDSPGYAGYFNCFNFALRKDLPHIEMGNTEDFHMINEILVHDYNYLGDGQKLKFGDILVYRNSGKAAHENLVHMAIYISPRVLLHKPSKLIWGMPEPIMYEAPENVLQRYRDSNRDIFNSRSDIYIESYRFKHGPWE